MKKIALYICSISILISIVGVGYLYNHFSCATQQPSVYQIRTTSEKIIGIIGDSWVTHQKLDTIIENALQDTSWRVVSFGDPGAATKRVYENLCKDTSKTYSSKRLLESGATYVVVLAGVNDIAGCYGKKFYSYHMRCIIQTLLEYNIRPVIVTVPQFGIQTYHDALPWYKRLRDNMYCRFTTNGILNTIQSCRDELHNQMQARNLFDSVVVVDFDQVIKEYYTNVHLYRDPQHLTLEGNQKLGQYIARCIARDWQKYNQ